MAGVQRDLGRLMVFPWQVLPPGLQGQVQSGYSLELWKHLGVTEGWGLRESRGGLLGKKQSPHWPGN